MQEFRVLRMGTVCEDKASRILGQITLWLMGMSGQITYFLQPKGLNDEGQPLSTLHMPVERLIVKDDDFEKVEIPFEILGTEVEDNASGFNGMATGFVCHFNGCFHVIIQPPGVVEKTGQHIKDADFDLRRCSGEKIPVLTPVEKKESEKKQPSPTSDRLPEIREG